MRLLRVELKNWRGYAGGPYAFEFAPDCTIVTGPNEDGKSTVFEAVRRALFDRARGQAGWIDRLVPYTVPGAIPQVTLDFQHRGRTIRVAKSFGARGSTELSEERSGAWVRIAANEEAEERLLELLGANASTKRVGSTSESWGPFQWLFVPQDDRALPNGKSDAASFLGLDRAGISLDFEQVQRAIEGEYSELFTPTGKLTASSELKQLEKEIEQLQERRHGLEEDLRKVAQLERQFEEAQQELPRLREDVETARADWESIDSEAVDLSGAESNLRAAQETHKSADQRAVQAAAVAKDRRAREADAEQSRNRLEAARLAQTQTKVALDQLRKRLDDTRHEATQLGDAVAQRRRGLSEAQRILQIRQAEARIIELRNREMAAKALDARLRDLEVAKVVAFPGREEVTAAQQLNATFKAKQASGQKLGLQIEVTDHPELCVIVDGHPLAGSHGVAVDAVVIEAPLGGSVTVRGDTSEAQRLADQATDAARQLSEILARFDVPTLEALQDLHDRELERRHAIASVQRERNAVDERPAEQILIEIEQLAAEVETLESRQPSSSETTDIAALAEPEIKNLIVSLGDAIAIDEAAFQERRQERERVAGLYREAEEQERVTNQELQSASALNEAAQGELDRHRDRHGSTEKCVKEERESRNARHVAGDAEKAARDGLARLQSDAEGRRKTARRTYDRLSQTLAAVEARARQLAETIEREVAAGNYSRLAEIERKIETEEARFSRLTLRAKALKQLKGIADEVRARVVSRVIGPIKETLDVRLSALTLGRYCLAELDEQLQPVRLTGDVACEIQDGSQGLRELVTTLIRTSVASHLAAEEPQTLILDDPCVHVSRERTTRLVTLLNELVEREQLQVVILTHRPQEFAGLAGKEVRIKSSTEDVAT